jgi:lipoprotein-releasing system permease protein
MLNEKFTKNIRKRFFSLKIAFRYIFSKKSHNAINVISGISATGVAIGTMALVVVLSVFNGFEQLIANMFSAFDPDFRITAVEGKSFEINDEKWKQLREMPDVAVFTEVVEENALLRFRDRQMAATVKGVGENYQQLTDIDSIMYDGKFELFDGAFERAVAGIGLAGSLSLGAHFIDPLYIYAPKRTSRINMLRPKVVLIRRQLLHRAFLLCNKCSTTIIMCLSVSIWRANFLSMMRKWLVVLS